MRQLIVLLLLSVLILQTANAQEPLIVRQLNVEDGLSQSTVHDIFQDSYGFIWVGTENGVNRYDGHEFKQITAKGGDLSTMQIDQAQVVDIGQDVFGKMWFATFSGIFIYDPIADEIEHVSPKTAPQSGLVTAFIASVLRHSNGTMWVASYEGLHHYSYEDKRFILHPIPESLIKDAKAVLRVVEAPDGNLILGTQDKGVFKYDIQSGEFSRLYYIADKPEDVRNEIRALYFDSRQALWIGTNQGLILFDYQQKKVVSQVLDEIEIEPMQRQRIRSITEDDEGTIWVSIYGDGIVAINPRNMSHKLYGYVPSVRHGLSSDSIRKLFFDDGGLLWIGTEGYGANIWNPVSKAFGHVTHKVENTNSLSNNVVWTIETDAQQNIWVGTDNGLNRISADGKTITRFLTKDKSRQQLASDLIYNIEFDPQTGDIWVATDRGVSRLAPDSGEVKNYMHQPDNPDSMPDEFVYDIELDNNRQLWMATSGGLLRLDLNKDRLYHYQHIADDPNSLTKNTSVSKLFIDAANHLWVGTDNGLNRYNPELDNFTRFLYTEGASYNADISFISSIAEVKRNVLWVGYSGRGIDTLDFHQNPNEPKVSHLDINDGLPTNIIFGIIPDHFGRAWISTMNGLMLYDMNGLNHRVFGAKEGLLGSEFNDGAYNVGKDGSIYFGTTNGLAIIKPGLIHTPKTSDRLYFTKAVAYRGQSAFEQPLISKKSIDLAYDTYALRLQFSDLNYYASAQTHYAYRYQNRQDNWIDLGNDNAITLSNLAIGTHQLQLRNRTGGGDWGEPNSLKIVIHPPWWKTPQAYGTYVLSLALIIYLLYYNRRERVREKRHINRQLQLFAEAFKNTTEGVMIMHSSRTIVAVNKAFTTITGYTEQEAIDAGTDIINSDKHSPDFYEHIWQTLMEQHQWHGEIWQNNKYGSDIAVDMTVSAVTNEEQQVSHFVAVFSDITERLAAEQELRKLAKYDSLTGLPNRTLLQDRLEHAISHGKREQHRLAVLFLDLDRFKQVNDSLGHDIGDLLLIAVSERISQILREDDTFARLGGDEFVVIIEDVTEISQLVHVANRIIEELTTPFALVDYEVTSSTSIGITLFPDDGDTSQVLLKNADTAMYHAKAQGRNNFQFYTQSMNDQVFERLSVENELRHAIEHNEFVLYYQPRVNSKTGNVESLEALIRWQHPTKGLVSPGYFINIAEDSGLIVPISEWVIKEACRQLRAWRKADFLNVSVSVNLSPRLFTHYDLVKLVEDNLLQYQIPALKLELEITEGMLMHDVESTIVDLHRLNELGCHISVDDFGTGYSSLSYLHRFPVHTLKIDRSFVNNIDQHDKGKALVDIIINLAQNLGMTLVAEGVETQAQFEFLKSRAEQQIQGFYFSKPVDAESVLPMLIKGFEV